MPRAILLALAFFTVYYLLYGWAALAADGYPTRYQWYWAWETDLPLWPWTAWVYLSLNLMFIPLLRRFPTPRQLAPVLATVAVELAAALFLFWLVPLEDGFPPVPGGGILGAAHVIALRHNYFPSLHVTLAYTAAFTIGGRWMLAWATAIALSTFTTHQHHVVDVVGGLVLAWVCVRFVWRRLRVRLVDRGPGDRVAGRGVHGD